MIDRIEGIFTSGQKRLYIITFIPEREVECAFEGYLVSSNITLTSAKSLLYSIRIQSSGDITLDIGKSLKDMTVQELLDLLHRRLNAG